MTDLRKLMLEELERRNYSQSTARAYLMTIRDFARYFRQSPDALGPEHIRQYQAYLFRERKLAANSVNQRVGALRFFFIKTLKKTWSVDETPYPKRVIRLPRVFSPEEVGRLIDSATTPFYRTILMTLYATGVRRAELAHLKVSDIDSKRMVIHVQGGKGRKDIMLSPRLLEVLREHWRSLKRKPKVWLRCKAARKAISTASTSRPPVCFRSAKMRLSSVATSRAISWWIASAAFFPPASACPPPVARGRSSR